MQFRGGDSYQKGGGGGGANSTIACCQRQHMEVYSGNQSAQSAEKIFASFFSY